MRVLEQTSVSEHRRTYCRDAVRFDASRRHLQAVTRWPARVPRDLALDIGPVVTCKRSLEDPRHQIETFGDGGCEALIKLSLIARCHDIVA